MMTFQSDGSGDSPEMAEVLNRVEARLHDSLDRHRRLRARVKIALTVVAGIGIFASGIAAAAVLPAGVLNPGNGTTQNGDGTTVSVAFAVDCYASSRSTAPSSSVQFAAADRSGTSAAEHDPSSACEAMRSLVDAQRAVSAEVKSRQGQGQRCGYIEVDGKSWYFDSSGSAKDTVITDGTPSPTPGPDCTSVTRITVSKTRLDATIECAIAGNWAAVFLRDDESAATVCRRHGYTVWSVTE